MTKLCFSLLLLTALTGVLAKVDWSGVLPCLKPPSIMPFGFLLLLYIPPSSWPCRRPPLATIRCFP